MPAPVTTQMQTLTPKQQAAAEREYSDHAGLTWWYWATYCRMVPRSREDDVISTLRLALWQACRKRQLRPELQEYSISSIFKNTARTELKEDYRQSSKQYGIKSRDIYSEGAAALRNVRVIFFDQHGEKEDGPVFQLTAEDDPAHDVEVWQQWAKLTDQQRELVRMKVDGLTEPQIAHLSVIPVAQVRRLVAELKGIYNIRDRRPMPPPKHSLEALVSERLGITKKAAKSRIFRARKALGLSGDSWPQRDTIIEYLEQQR